MPSSSNDEPASPDSAPDSAVSFRGAAADVKNAVRAIWRSVQHWVETRGRLTQLVIGGVVAKLLEAIVGKSAVVWSFAVTSVPVMSEVQLLVLLVVVGLVQTAVQTSKLKGIEQNMGNMTTSPDATTDGGRDAHSENEAGVTSAELVRMIVLAYALIGAVFGSSYGVGGAVFGATVGAIFADMLVKRGR